MRKILIIVAHPDDEILGCGGTIAKHSIEGDDISVVILAEGITSRDKIRNINIRKKELYNLRASAQKANKILGVKNLLFNNFPDNRMDSIDLLDVIKFIENIIDKINPDIVYTHFFNDLNVDHKIINQAVITACRPIPDQKIKTILFFEVTSSTEYQISNNSLYFNPNWFVDISDTLSLKLKALGVYKSEMRDYPHSRSIKAITYLAKWRGASVGLLAVEAFVLGRNIV